MHGCYKYENTVVQLGRKSRIVLEPKKNPAMRE